MFLLLYSPRCATVTPVWSPLCDLGAFSSAPIGSPILTSSHSPGPLPPGKHQSTPCFYGFAYSGHFISVVIPSVFYKHDVCCRASLEPIKFRSQMGHTSYHLKISFPGNLKLVFTGAFWRGPRCCWYFSDGDCSVWPFESQLHTWGSEGDPGICSSTSGMAVNTAESHSCSTNTQTHTGGTLGGG